MHPGTKPVSRIVLAPASCVSLAWLILRPRRWGRYDPRKRWFTFTGLQGVISQKMEYFIATAVRTSNPEIISIITPLIWRNCRYRWQISRQYDSNHNLGFMFTANGSGLRVCVWQAARYSTGMPRFIALRRYWVFYKLKVCGNFNFQVKYIS
jgi:hypothetical protein